MERNPKEYEKLQYYKNVRYRKIRPLFFWYKCDKCGNEFRRETMYELIEPSIIGVSWDYHKRGCQNCFPTKEHFKKWCEEEILLKPEDFDDIRNLLF